MGRLVDGVWHTGWYEPDAGGAFRRPETKFRARVTALYETMHAALRAGDWRAYGDAWAALGQLLGRR